MPFVSARGVVKSYKVRESTLSILRELRKDFPETGAVLQAMLHRTESDCRALAYEGSRVRLCKGAYNEPEEVAWQDRHDVDKSYVRCLKVLMAGEGYPMVATHDPRLVKIASALATTSRQFGLTLGVAVVGAIVSSGAGGSTGWWTLTASASRASSRALVAMTGCAAASVASSP